MAKNSHELIDSLVAELLPVRPLQQGGGMGRALIALVLGVAGMFAMYSPRADLAAGQPDAMLLMGGGLFLVLALASSWAVVDMARPFVGVHRDGWGWTALMAAVLPVAAVVTMLSARLRGLPSGFAMDGWGCMAAGLLFSLLTFAALILWLRRGAPMLPARAGLLIGVAAGSAGIFAASLFCPHNELIHIGVWHGLSVVIAGLAGWIAVPRLIAW